MQRIARRGSLAALIALTAAQAAQAQEGIWVRCERAPGAPASDDGSFVGPMVFGTDTFRTYDEANRRFSPDYCRVSEAHAEAGGRAQCAVTEDEITFEKLSVEDGRSSHYAATNIRGSIDRRTGHAIFTIADIGQSTIGNHRYERVCRRTTDPRPPRAF